MCFTVQIYCRTIDSASQKLTCFSICKHYPLDHRLGHGTVSNLTYSCNCKNLQTVDTPCSLLAVVSVCQCWMRVSTMCMKLVPIQSVLLRVSITPSVNPVTRSLDSILVFVRLATLEHAAKLQVRFHFFISMRFSPRDTANIYD